MGRRCGLTLVELLVVLVILVILTTIAIQSTSNLADQARFDATQRTLQNIQNAIVGPAGQREPDGTPLITGFVADNGRLPIATADATGALTLNELWSNPNAIPTFGAFNSGLATTPAPTDPDITVYAGWRGPYLQLPPGSAQLTDGWGNPLSNSASNATMTLLQKDGQTPVTPGEHIHVVVSPGANFGVTGSTYNYSTPSAILLLAQLNSTAQLQLNTPAPSANLVLATVTGNIYLKSASMGTISPTSTLGVQVKLFGPTWKSGSFNVETPVTPTIPTNGTVVTYSVTTTVGPRSIRAYYQPGGTGPMVYKSRIVRLILQPGAQTHDLYVDNVP